MMNFHHDNNYNVMMVRRVMMMVMTMVTMVMMKMTNMMKGLIEFDTDNS